VKIKIAQSSELNLPVINVLTKKPGRFSGDFPKLEHQVTREGAADAYLCPHNLSNALKDANYLKYLKSISLDKPVFIFNTGDFPAKQVPGNFYYLQYSSEVGVRIDLKRTIIIPANIRPVPSSVRSFKRGFPEIGFVGQIPSLSLGRLLRSVVPIPPLPMQFMIPHPIKRNSALIRALGAREIINANGTVLSRRNHGGSFNGEASVDFDRSIYEAVLSHCDFFFCPRGDANASLRLYETISAGRIPIVPRTDVLFPYAGNFNLKKLFLVVRPSSIGLSSSISSFWDSLSTSDYQYIQFQLKLLFEKVLRFDVFLENLFKLNLDDLELIKPTSL
jgi:hypothetical protein